MERSAGPLAGRQVTAAAIGHIHQSQPGQRVGYQAKIRDADPANARDIRAIAADLAANLAVRHAAKGRRTAVDDLRDAGDNDSAAVRRPTGRAQLIAAQQPPLVAAIQVHHIKALGIALAGKGHLIAIRAEGRLEAAPGQQAQPRPVGVHDIEVAAVEGLEYDAARQARRSRHRRRLRRRLAIHRHIGRAHPGPTILAGRIDDLQPALAAIGDLHPVAPAQLAQNRPIGCRPLAHIQLRGQHRPAGQIRRRGRRFRRRRGFA